MFLIKQNAKYVHTSGKSADVFRERTKRSTAFHEYTAFVIETSWSWYDQRLPINLQITVTVKVWPAIW